MNDQNLSETAQALLVDDKGLLAMDESNPTCNKRFATLGIPQTVEARRTDRDLLVTTPDLGEPIGGAILYDETIRQKTRDGIPFTKALIQVGIIPGIKVDAGANDMALHPGEKITDGLDGIFLTPNTELPGLDCPEQESIDEVADAAVNCLLRSVPASVAGIAFLSGGQSSELASARLNAMNVRCESTAPWPLAFSFARAIQQPAMEIWSGKEANVEAAQTALAHRAHCDRMARRGEYSAEMESTEVASVGVQR